MLVIARRGNQSFMIGEDIEVVVVEIRGDQVKLGIKAPKTVSVYRKEVFDEIRKANIEAGRQDIEPSVLQQLGNLLPGNKSPKKKTD